MYITRYCDTCTYKLVTLAVTHGSPQGGGGARVGGLPPLEFFFPR